MHCQVSSRLGNGGITARKTVCEKNTRVDTAALEYIKKINPSTIKLLDVQNYDINMNVVNKLAEYNVDMASMYTIGKQATISILINQIIRYAHQLIIGHLEENIDMSFLEVRTRKILSYSNVIASTSNVLEVGIRSMLGDVSSINKLDIGGLGVTIYRVISDSRYQKRIKYEFMVNRWNELLDEI